VFHCQIILLFQLFCHICSIQVVKNGFSLKFITYLIVSQIYKIIMQNPIFF